MNQCHRGEAGGGILPPVKKWTIKQHFSWRPSKILSNSPYSKSLHSISSWFSSPFGLPANTKLYFLNQSFSFTDIDDCAGNQCKPNGKCIDGVNSYRCECDPGYTGKHCEKSMFILPEKLLGSPFYQHSFWEGRSPMIRSYWILATISCSRSLLDSVYRVVFLNYQKGFDIFTNLTEYFVSSQISMIAKTLHVWTGQLVWMESIRTLANALKVTREKTVRKVKMIVSSLGGVFLLKLFRPPLSCSPARSPRLIPRSSHLPLPRLHLPPFPPLPSRGAAFNSPVTSPLWKRCSYVIILHFLM